MNNQKRRKFTPEFKAKVALEALKEQSTVISRWKSEFAANMSAVFKKSNSNEAPEENVDIEKLYAQIGQLKVENDFLKKSCKRLGI